MAGRKSKNWFWLTKAGAGSRSGTGVILIVSSDFSHEATIEEAKKSDKQSIASLQQLDKGKINQTNCDCRACLAVMLGYLGGSNFSFQLVDNKNSSDFGGTDQNVTSYISGYFIFR